MMLRLRVQTKTSTREGDPFYEAWLIEDTPDGPRALRADTLGEWVSYPEGGRLPAAACIGLHDVKGIDFRPGSEISVLAPEAERGGEIPLTVIATVGRDQDWPAMAADQAYIDWIVRDERTGQTLQITSAPAVVRTVTIRTVG